MLTASNRDSDAFLGLLRSRGCTWTTYTLSWAADTQQRGRTQIKVGVSKAHPLKGFVRAVTRNQHPSPVQDRTDRDRPSTRIRASRRTMYHPGGRAERTSPRDPALPLPWLTARLYHRMGFTPIATATRIRLSSRGIWRL